jgi:DNA polymerase III subunit epsilon
MSFIRELILDTETTGLDPQSGDRIVEIGIVEMQNKVLTGKKFHFYLNPERDMPTAAYRVHGISGEFLKDKPLFRDIANEFLSFIHDGILIIHNAPFDIKFLNHELSLVNKPSLELSQTIDTLSMARRLFPGMKTNLDALCKRFKVDNSGRKLHGALRDAVLLAEVYVELTGGRQVAFNIPSKQNVNQRLAKQSGNLVNKNTKIMGPTKEEIAKHKEFLSKISYPVWLS